MANLTPNVCDGFGNAVNLDENGVAVTAAPGKNINLETSNGGVIQQNGSGAVLLNPTAVQTISGPTEELILDNTNSGTGPTLAIGVPLGLPVNGGGIMLTGYPIASEAATVEIHNEFASGIQIFSHTVASGFRSPTISLKKSRGTQLVPTAPLNGDALGEIAIGGYTGTAYGVSVFLEAVATENWSATNNGTELIFSVTPTGQPLANSVTCLTLNGDGNGGVTVSRILTLLGGAAGALVIANKQSPTSAATAGITGQIIWDAGFLYVCTVGGAAGAATWTKTALVPA